MPKLALAGFLAAAGTAWFAFAQANDQGDEPRQPLAPVIKLSVAAVLIRRREQPLRDHWFLGHFTGLRGMKVCRENTPGTR